MTNRSLRRRVAHVAPVLALLLAVVPFVTFADHGGSRTEITFTSTFVEEVATGEFWIDEAGIGHGRNFVDREEASGDLSGEVLVTFNFDFQPVGEQGYFTAWALVEITDETGRWEGHFMVVGSDVPGDEFYFDSLVLRGLGGNAGMSIAASSVDEDEDSITFEGILSTTGLPNAGLNTMVSVCFNEDFTTSGGFLSSGAIGGSGSASAAFITGDLAVDWVHRYGLWGEVMLSDNQGSATVVFGGVAQDIVTPTEFSSNGWGHFIIVDGDGAYADLYGAGRLTGSAMLMPQCPLGFGVLLYLVGEASN